MKYSKQEVMQYVMEENVKFIRLAFCDIFGVQKNISITPKELPRAFEYGIGIDASAVDGFGDDQHSDLFLHPEPETLAVFPWRSEHGKVVRMFCTVKYKDGTVFENDSRAILAKAVEAAGKHGYSFYFGTEMEFYLFKLDENGERTMIPHDRAGYLDIAPEDKGENVRREICLTLEEMGIYPESSHHEEGPGQNEIDFKYADALESADNAMTFNRTVKAIAARNGLYADFSPKPLASEPGNGQYINISVKKAGSAENLLPHMIAGILDKVSEMTLFLNPTENSYMRLGSLKAPKYISWSPENRTQLLRVPAAEGEYVRAELRSPDSTSNPYLTFALLIYAGLYGIQNRLPLPEPANVNFHRVSAEILNTYKKLPASRAEAAAMARSSEFIHNCLPESIIDAYCNED